MKSICEEIDKVLSDKMFGNLHIFVNSVDFIASVIKTLGLQPEQVKVVCSNNTNMGKGVKSNQKKLGEDYRIQRPLDPVKRFNFYTSTCFEGCDIYDPDGKTYIVSDGNRRHTQLDISTLLIQICGRIRNSKYPKVTHIFSYTKYDGKVSLEEFKQRTLKDYEESRMMLEDLNQLSEESRKKIIRGFSDYYCNENYISNIDNKLYLDKNLLNLDIVNFKVATGIYSSRIAYIQELNKEGLEHDYNRYNYFQSADAIKENQNVKLSFKNVFEDYVQLQANKSGFGLLNQEIQLIDKEKPLIGKAFDKLGVDKVRALKYNVSNIKAELIKMSDVPQTKKIKEMILEKIGYKISEDSTIKQVIQSIYNDLDIYKTAKSTDLNKYFDTKKYVRDGTRYTELLREKIIYQV